MSDTQTQPETIDHFLERLGITAEWTPTRTVQTDVGPAQVYDVEFSRNFPHGAVAETFEFTDSVHNLATGKRSTTAAVFNCLTSDAFYANECNSVADLAAEFGEAYDADGIRKLTETFEQLQANDEKLRTLLVDDYDTAVYELEQL